MIPESISAIYYLLSNRGWIFQLIMALTGLCLLPPWLEATPDKWQFLPFLSCMSLLFVAAAPQFRLRLDGAVHYASAIVCGACAVLWMFLQDYGDVFLPCFVGSALLSVIRPKEYMLWLECSIVVALTTALFWF